jgi:hypothetical protein
MRLEPSERVREAAVIVRDYLAWTVAEAARAGDAGALELASSLCREPVYSFLDRLADPHPQEMSDEVREVRRGERSPDSQGTNSAGSVAFPGKGKCADDCAE